MHYRLYKSVVIRVLLFLVVSAGALSFVSYAQNREQRIHKKAQLVEATAAGWLQQGKNPSQAVVLMRMASKAFDSGDPEKGEALVDEAMVKLGLATAGSSKTLPANLKRTSPQSAVSELYGPAELVEIVGFDQDAMEPCISLDGKYLFFNTSNEDDIPVHLHQARRMPDGRFQYLGELPGTHSAHRDMVPTIDSQGVFYFTRFTDFGKTRKSVCVGHWANEKVSDTQLVDGDMCEGCGIEQGSLGAVKGATVNMDCGVSPDGNTLYISRASIVPGAPGPHVSDLLIANRNEQGHFNLSPQSQKFLEAVNTEALEYAPCITADGLELYFTRAMNEEQFALADAGAGLFETMVALRASTDKPFGPPMRLAAVHGYAEAPALTLDKREMYFHKKDGKRFRIYRAIRQ